MKTRLQRFLADCGVASRRECEQMIMSGRVRVNGETRTLMPVLIEPGKDIVTVDDEEIGADGKPGAKGADGLAQQPKVYFLLNKPKGILVTNHDPSNRKTVGELMAGVAERVFPVGRLDMDSRGALIMTNDGELANRLTHPRYGIEKTYIVEADGRIGHGDLEKIKRGIWLGPNRPGPGAQGAVKTEGFKIKLIGRETGGGGGGGRTLLEVRISEAKGSEIRRVMARLGHTVRDLNRVAIAGKITTKGLEVGKFRTLTEAEIKWLFKASSSEFHTEQKTATQAWYEAKEMEKERKRLEREAPEPVKKKLPASASQPKLKEFRPRPERKGKKPFIPKTGRNAGKPLGGNFAGRQRLEREARNSSSSESHIASESVHEHPLGENVHSEE